MARQSRMRCPHCEAAIYLQVAERLSLCRNNCKFAMGDTSSVCSADSFPSKGKPSDICFILRLVLKFNDIGMLPPPLPPLPDFAGVCLRHPPGAKSAEKRFPVRRASSPSRESPRPRRTCRRVRLNMKGLRPLQTSPGFRRAAALRTSPGGMLPQGQCVSRGIRLPHRGSCLQSRLRESSLSESPSVSSDYHPAAGRTRSCLHEADAENQAV